MVLPGTDGDTGRRKRALKCWDFLSRPFGRKSSTDLYMNSKTLSTIQLSFSNRQLFPFCLKRFHFLQILNWACWPFPLGERHTHRNKLSKQKTKHMIGYFVSAEHQSRYKQNSHDFQVAEQYAVCREIWAVFFGIYHKLNVVQSLSFPLFFAKICTGIG